MPADTKPPVVTDLDWRGDLSFSAASGRTTMLLDGRSAAGPSPVQALTMALAGCMAADLVTILTKGRHQLRAFHSRMVAQRAPTDPHRLVRIELHLILEGPLPQEVVDRAIALSREKYCSVWHSLRQDIDFTVTSEIRA